MIEPIPGDINLKLLFKKSVSVMFRVDAKNDPTFIVASLPINIPLGLIRKILPFAFNLPKISL